jgi:hypothetical protein
MYLMRHSWRWHPHDPTRNSTVYAAATQLFMILAATQLFIQTLDWLCVLPVRPLPLPCVSTHTARHATLLPDPAAPACKPSSDTHMLCLLSTLCSNIHTLLYRASLRPCLHFSISTCLFQPQKTPMSVHLPHAFTHTRISVQGNAQPALF